MEKFIHSVTLDKDLCKGCINCIKRCPTEAIRVRDGKAHILAERCIDCGECIRICPHHAKKPLYDPLTILDDFKYTIALPPPSLYGQYNNLEEQDVVLAALLDMGFDDVYEVAKAAELVSDATRRILQTGCEGTRNIEVGTRNIKLTTLDKGRQRLILARRKRDK